MKELFVNTGKISLKVWWMLVKVYIPLSLFTTFLKFSGFFDWLSPYLSPLMHILGLPGEASLTLIAANLGNVYSGIATIPALDLTFRQVTILGIIIGFSHNLFVETGILMKLKFARVGFALFRIFFGIIAGVMANLILPENIEGAVLNPYMNPETFSWTNSIKGMLVTCLQVMALIFVLNFLYELAKQWKYRTQLKVKMQKISSLMGLSPTAMVPWMAGFIFGIVYGAGILFQFAEKNTLTHKDVCLVTVFMVLAHAIVEDTIIFMVLGANFWWLFTTRIVLGFTIMKLLSIKNLYKKFLWIGLTKNKIIT
jgi:spore maturation protein SpmB